MRSYQQPIPEAHFDELFPRGMDKWVLVLKDEHGRMVATQAVDQRDEESVKPFLQRMKDIGLRLQSFYIDGCPAYYTAIRAVFGQAVKFSMTISTFSRTPGDLCGEGPWRVATRLKPTVNRSARQGTRRN
jgi:MULE transposase domain.